jgi:protease IV
MNEPTASPTEQPVPTIVIQQPGRRLVIWFLMLCLGFSLLFNLGFLAAFSEYTAGSEPPIESFHSGTLKSRNKIARLKADFTIMPPFSRQLIETIQHVRDDDAVKGALLIIDSPGGLVTDSHQIYHELKQLSEKKPVIIQMKGVAASGGYYIAMGGGPEAEIFAEPTTWTGSIGVIIPRYDLTGLGEKVGIKSDSLSTGPFKDTLNPLKEMADEERAVWREIMEDAFDRFLEVIDEGRANLDPEQVRELATGQVYTASQALEKGLVDRIGFEEEALETLKSKLGLDEVRVVEYRHPKTFVETLLGVSSNSSEAKIEIAPLGDLFRSNVPRAMYLFGWQSELLNSVPGSGNSPGNRK